MPCVLTDRATDKPAAADTARTGLITGEYEVTGSFDQTSAANWNRAREAAIARARETLLARLTCVGGCETEGHFCVLDVRVLVDRSGQIVRRMIENEPDSFPYKNGEKASEHVYLTYEIQAEAFCRCEAPPRAPALPGGKVEHYGPPLPAPAPLTSPAPGYYYPLPKGGYGWPLGGGYMKTW